MRRRDGAIVVMAVALAGCRAVDAGAGPASPVAPSPGEATRRAAGAPQAIDVTVAASKPQASDPPASERPAAGAGEVQVVPAPQAIVPIELPFPRLLVVRPLDEVSNVVLFPDEADAVRRRVVQSLATHGHAVLPSKELERIEAAAAAGRLVLEGDQVCRAPLAPTELVARYFADWPFAEVEAVCFDECRLQVSISDPRQPDYFAGYASGKVARPHDPRAWVSAAARLRMADQFGGVGFGLSGSSHPPPVQFELAQGIGPWASPVEDVSFMAAEGLAAACAHPDPLAGFTYRVRASVDERGRVSRCLATSDHSLMRPDDAACVCGSLEALEIPPGRPGRRFHVQATDHGGFGAAGASLELVQPGTEPWRRRIDESLALARCMAAGVPPGGFAGTITLSLAPDGGVQDVRIDGDITTPPAMAMASCLVQELRLVPLPCRPPGIDALQLRLAIKGP